MHKMVKAHTIRFHISTTLYTIPLARIAPDSHDMNKLEDFSTYDRVYDNHHANGYAVQKSGGLARSCRSRNKIQSENARGCILSEPSHFGAWKFRLC